MEEALSRTECESGPFAPHLNSGLRLLLQSYDYALDLGRSIWDFAVEIGVLRKLGMSNSDFRWLICKGYLHHGCEITFPGEEGRQFRPCGQLSFYKRTCFTLTDSGADTVRSARLEEVAPVMEREPEMNGHLELAVRNGHARLAELDVAVPRWDADRQELRLGNLIVKQFKLPSPNQETVLMAFEEDGWPARIDDPLPPHPDLDPKRRLHDTIKSLNRNQKHRALRFKGDGKGEGILWEHVALNGQNGVHAAGA